MKREHNTIVVLIAMRVGTLKKEKYYNNYCVFIAVTVQK